MAKCLICDVCPFDSSQVESSGYSLPTASATQLGGVKVGGGLSITADGILNCTLSGGLSYTFPIAGISTLGGVMIGNGLSIADDGTLNVTATGGQSNVIESISLDGTIQPIVNKTAIIGLSAYAKQSELAGTFSSIYALSAAIGGLSNYALPTASTSIKGGIIIGNGLSMAGDTLNVTLSSADIIDEAISLFIEAFQLAGS